MMSEDQRSIGSRWVRRVVVAFVLATCVRVWLGSIDVLPSAAAQIPDGGTQRRELIVQARTTNELLGEILAILKTGTLNVRDAGTDKTGDGLAPAGRGKP